MKTAQKIQQNGAVVTIAPKNGKDFTLDELREIVGGYIEIINWGDSLLIVCDEEGKLKGKECNMVANINYPLRGGDFWVGDILVCDASMIK